MTDNNIQTKPINPSNSQLADIVSGFKDVLKKCGASDTSVVELTLIDHKLEKEGALVLPQGCKHKCWYNSAANLTQCGIVCSI